MSERMDGHTLGRRTDATVSSGPVALTVTQTQSPMFSAGSGKLLSQMRHIHHGYSGPTDQC